MRYLTVALVILGLAGSGCGGYYKIDVNVKHTFSSGEIQAAFEAQCRREHPEYDPFQVKDCGSDKLATLVMDIADAFTGK